MQTIMEMLYVVMPSVPLDQKLYAVPYLGHEDLPQQIDPSMEDLTTTNLNSIRVSAIVARAKYARVLRDEQLLFFFHARLCPHASNTAY